MSDNLSNIVESTEAEQLATGFIFTEGPLWHPDGALDSIWEISVIMCKRF